MAKIYDFKTKILIYEHQKVNKYKELPYEILYKRIADFHSGPQILNMTIEETEDAILLFEAFSNATPSHAEKMEARKVADLLGMELDDFKRKLR